MFKYKNKFEEVKFYKKENGKPMVFNNEQKIFKDIEKWEYFYIINDTFRDFYNHIFEIDNKKNYYDLKNYSSVYELVKEINFKNENKIIINIENLEESKIKYIIKNIKDKKIILLGYLKKISLKEIFYIDYHYNEYENFHLHIIKLNKEISFDNFFNNFVNDNFFNLEIILKDIRYQNIFLNTMEEEKKNKPEIEYCFSKKELAKHYAVNENNLSDDVLIRMQEIISTIKLSFFLRYFLILEEEMTETEKNIISVLSYYLIEQNKREISLDEIKTSKEEFSYETINKIMKANNISISKDKLQQLINKTKTLFFQIEDGNYFINNYMLLSWFASRYILKKEDLKNELGKKFFKNNILINKYEGIVYCILIKLNLEEKKSYKDIFKNVFKCKNEEKKIKINNFNKNAFNSLELYKFCINDNSIFKFLYIERYFSKSEIEKILEDYKKNNINYIYEKENYYYSFNIFLLNEDVNNIKKFIKNNKSEDYIVKLENAFLYNCQYRNDAEEINIEKKYIEEKGSIINSSTNDCKKKYINQTKNEASTFNDGLEILDIIDENNCKDNYFIDINMNYSNEKKREGKPKSENHISTNISKILKEEYGLRSAREEELEDKRRMDFTISNNTNANGYFIIEAKLFSNEIFNRTKKEPEKTYFKIKNNIENQLLRYLIDDDKKNGIYLIYNFSKNLLENSGLRKKSNDYENEKQNIKNIIKEINEKNNVNIIFKELFFE